MDVCVSAMYLYVLVCMFLCLHVCLSACMFRIEAHKDSGSALRAAHNQWSEHMQS